MKLNEKFNWNHETQEAFQASLSFIGTEKKAFDINMSDSDMLLEKLAGIEIDNSDIERLESSVKEYLSNELSFLGNTPNLQIFTTPISHDRENNGAILSAKGLAKLVIQDKEIVLPFLVEDGRLLPFDVIQMKGERIPFSRENLRKIIDYLNHMKSSGVQEENNPFIGLEGKTNPATSSGFLADIMSIRDRHINRRGPMVSTAASEFDIQDLLEKVATMKPLTQVHFEKIAENINEKQYQKNLEKLAKLEAEDEAFEKTASKKLNDNLEMMDDLDKVEASTLDHGTVVLFPMLTRGNEIETVKAMVIKSLVPMAKGNKIKSILVSEDGRYKLLNATSGFKVIKSPLQQINLRATSTLQDLSTSDTFLMETEKDSNTFFSPQLVTSSTKNDSRRNDAVYSFSSTWQEEVSYTEKTLLKNSLPIQVMELEDEQRDSGFLLSKDMIKIAPMNGTDMARIPYNEFITAKATELGMEISDVRKFLYREALQLVDGKVLACDFKKPVIRLVGELACPFYEDSFSDEDVEIDESSEKTASTKLTGNIFIRLVDFNTKTYSVNISYNNPDNKVLKKEAMDFYRITEGKTRAILRILKFSPEEASKILFKMKKIKSMKVSIPSAATIEDLAVIDGGTRTNVTAENIKQTAVRIAKPDTLATAMASGITTALIADAFNQHYRIHNPAKGRGNKFTEYIYSAVCDKRASVLACEFEKLAKTHKCDNMLAVAEVLAIGANYFDKVANTLNDDYVYSDMKKVSNTIVNDVTPYMEKLSHDLFDLKYNQVMNEDNFVPNHLISNAINIFDNINKVANEMSNVGFEV